MRPDGRAGLTSFRPVSISVGSITTADGSAIVKQGETIIVCGIKAELAKPKPETPCEGTYKSHAYYELGCDHYISKKCPYVLGHIINYLFLQLFCITKAI